MDCHIFLDNNESSVKSNTYNYNYSKNTLSYKQIENHSTLNKHSKLVQENLQRNIIENDNDRTSYGESGINNTTDTFEKRGQRRSSTGACIPDCNSTIFMESKTPKKQGMKRVFKRRSMLEPHLLDKNTLPKANILGLTIPNCKSFEDSQSNVIERDRRVSSTPTSNLFQFEDPSARPNNLKNQNKIRNENCYFTIYFN